MEMALSSVVKSTLSLNIIACRAKHKPTLQNCRRFWEGFSQNGETLATFPWMRFLCRCMWSRSTDQLSVNDESWGLWQPACLFLLRVSARNHSCLTWHSSAVRNIPAHCGIYCFRPLILRDSEHTHVDTHTWTHTQSKNPDSNIRLTLGCRRAWLKNDVGRALTL